MGFVSKKESYTIERLDSVAFDMQMRQREKSKKAFKAKTQISRQVRQRKTSFDSIKLLYFKEITYSGEHLM